MDSSSEIELRVCKLSESDFIISYIEDGYIYALQTSKEDSVKGLEFSKILEARSHCFALDKSNNLHLYYVTNNGALYDKTIGSEYNDVCVSENVKMVYATKLGVYQSGEIVIAFIDESMRSVKYLTLDNESYSVIRDIPVKHGYSYVDLSMISSDSFIYCVVQSIDGTNYILKSAFEPLASEFIEMISATTDVVTSKYYTLGELSGELIDEIKSTLNHSLNAVLNYERMIEDEAVTHISGIVTQMVDTYTMPKEDFVYTVVIDKATQDPEDRCTYADDAVDLIPAQVVANETTGKKDSYKMNGWDERWPFNQVRPCAFYEGEFIGYINPNDFTKFEDGTDVDSYNNKYDVMIEIPKIYYCVETIDEKIYCRISNKKVDDRFKCYAHVYDGKELDKIYIGAYVSTPIPVEATGGYSIISCSGQIPFVVYDNTMLEKYLHAKAEGYRFTSFDHLILLQCLYLILYRSTDSQSVFALGNTYGNEYAQGYCDTKGMFAGSLSAYTPCKFMGIENIYGACYWYVSGIAIKGQIIEDECYILRRDPYSSVPVNKEGDGYIAYRMEHLDDLYISAKTYLSDPIGTTEFGFIPQANKYNGVAGAQKRYFSDFAHFQSNCGYFAGGDYKSQRTGGIFCLWSNSPYAMNSGIGRQGYRLVYYPQGGN